MIAGHLPEILIIAVVALLFLGPKRLPEAGKGIGQAIRGFRTEVSGLHDEPESVAPEPLESNIHHTAPVVHVESIDSNSPADPPPA
jgi:sec-independent protein translocase protein TatA